MELPRTDGSGKDPEMEQINILLDEEYPNPEPGTRVEFETKTYEYHNFPLEKSQSGKTVKKWAHEWRVVDPKIITLERVKKELKEKYGNNIFVFPFTEVAEEMRPSFEGADILVQASPNIVGGVREILMTDPALDVRKEGPGRVLSREDTTFYVYFA